MHLLLHLVAVFSSSKIQFYMCDNFVVEMFPNVQAADEDKSTTVSSKLAALQALPMTHGGLTKRCILYGVVSFTILTLLVQDQRVRIA